MTITSGLSDTLRLAAQEMLPQGHRAPLMQFAELVQNTPSTVLEPSDPRPPLDDLRTNS
jgi:hypothetical protein